MRIGSTFAVVLIVWSALFVGCVEGIRIVVNDCGDGAPIFTLMANGVMASPGVEIDNFNVYSFPGKAEDFMWGIESLDNRRHVVEKIKYGIVPDGFREKLAPLRLVSGGHYFAGSLMSGKIGSVDFVLK